MPASMARINKAIDRVRNRGETEESTPIGDAIRAPSTRSNP
ncbi:hypothetical protein ACFS07_31965 [Undibacterium arcticum]